MYIGASGVEDPQIVRNFTENNLSLVRVFICNIEYVFYEKHDFYFTNDIHSNKNVYSYKKTNGALFERTGLCCYTAV